MYVIAIIVAYEAPALQLEASIERIGKQVDMVLVCNNSNAPFDHSAPNVKVFNFYDNVGIAKAQSVGMAWAFAHGADFILQMDQDSEASEGMVASLIKAHACLTQRGYKVGLVGPQDFDKFTGIVSRPRINKGQGVAGTKYLILSEILSSGSLISRAAYDAVGGMDDSLFIDGVDFEYCWRLNARGYVVVKNPEALLGHRLGDGQKKIFGLISVGISAPVRHYYSFRNALHLAKRPYTPWYWRISSFAKIVFKLLVYPLAFTDGRKRLFYMVKGLRDGVLGKYGRVDGKQ